MATIRNTIDMQDRMTPVFNRMITAMTKTLNVMEGLDTSTRNAMGDTSGITSAQKAINAARNDVAKLQRELDTLTDKKVNVAIDVQKNNALQASNLAKSNISAAQLAGTPPKNINATLSAPKNVFTPVTKEAEEADAAAQKLQRTINGIRAPNDTSFFDKTGKAASETAQRVSEFRNQQLGLNNSLDQGTNSAGGFIKALAGFSIIQKIISLVTGQLDAALSRMDTMSNFKRTMTAITGSSKASTASLNELKDATKGTAYGLDTAASAVQNFITRGMGIGNATNEVKKWMDAVAFYGDGTNEQLSMVADALGKMLTKGTVEMDQLNRLTDAGINAVGMYAQVTGKSAATVQDELSKGKIKALDFVTTVSNAFETGANGVLNISGAAKEAGATWATSLANMKAAVTRGLISIIDSINGSLERAGLGSMMAGVQQIGSMLESMLNSVASVAGVVTTLLSPILQLVGAIGSAISSNWGIIQPLIMGIVAALTLYTGALIAYKVATGIAAAVAGAHALAEKAKMAAMWMASDATFMDAAAQWGLNAALLACPITWIVLAFIAFLAILFLVVNAINAVAGTSISALGVVAGVVFAVGAAIYNIVMAVYNFIVFCVVNIANAISVVCAAIAAAWDYVWKFVANLAISVAEWVVNTWNSAVLSVRKFFAGIGKAAAQAFKSVTKSAASAANSLANAFISGANLAIKGINWIIDALNKIPGVDIGKVGELGKANIKADTSGLDSYINEMDNILNSKAEKVSFGRFEYDGYQAPDLLNANDYYADYKDLGQAYQNGYKWGENLQDKIGNYFKGQDGVEQDVGNIADYLETGAKNLGGGSGSGSGKNNVGKVGKVGSVGKVEDSIELSDEDIKMLKDIASTKYINKFTTLQPNMQVTFGDVHETADIDKIIDAIEDMTEKALAETILEE